MKNLLKSIWLPTAIYSFLPWFYLISGFTMIANDRIIVLLCGIGLLSHTAMVLAHRATTSRNSMH